MTQMKIKLNDTDKFKFLSSENGKPCHKHLMLIDGLFTEVPGASSIAGMFDDKGWFGYWAAGLALAPLGWVKVEKDGSNQKEVIAAAEAGWRIIERMETHEVYAKFLDKCYRAHAKETKDTAEAGTELHEWLEDYVKARIENKSIADLRAWPISFEKPVREFFKWEESSNVEFLASEVQVGSRLFEFCGIADFVAKINGRIVLGDFKTSKQWKDSWIPQLVGLKQCFQEMGQPIDDLMVVRLSRDGEFEVHPVVVDFEQELMAFIKAKDFLNSRNLFKWRRKQPALAPIFSEPETAS